MITINRSKAENIVKDRIRLEREPRLVELDTEYIKALETSSDVSSIVAKKQELRDVTLKDLSKLTIEELSGLTLDQALALP